jgi:AAA domain
MSNSVLIVGGSGTGKSTSIRNLDHKSTFVINVLGKAMPFRGYKKKYIPITGWDDTKGNYFASDDYTRILKCIEMVNKNRPDILSIVIDDWQYVLCNEFMRRANEKGFERFTEIGQHAWSILRILSDCRDNLVSFVLAHNDIDINGKSKVKTIGKLLDEKVTIEGMFTTVCHTQIIDGEYKFLTQHDNFHVAKSPMGLFSELLIDNDLKLVRDALIEYFNDGE